MATKTTTRKTTTRDKYSQATKFNVETAGMIYGGYKPLTAEEKRMKAESERKRRGTK